jgi:hypothetical protein
MGKGTITSKKHNMVNFPLKRASNGHFLLPFCEIPSEFQPDVSKRSADVSLAELILEICPVTYPSRCHHPMTTAEQPAVLTPMSPMTQPLQPLSRGTNRLRFPQK